MAASPTAGQAEPVLEHVIPVDVVPDPPSTTVAESQALRQSGPSPQRAEPGNWFARVVKGKRLSCRTATSLLCSD